MTHWKVTELGQPLDIGWEYLLSVKETYSKLTVARSLQRFETAGDLGTIDPEKFLNDWQLAFESAQAAGYDGIPRQQPVVFWIPDEFTFQYAFVIKQDNNGQTFVISQVPLPHIGLR